MGKQFVLNSIEPQREMTTSDCWLQAAVERPWHSFWETVTLWRQCGIGEWVYAMRYRMFCKIFQNFIDLYIFHSSWSGSLQSSRLAQKPLIHGSLRNGIFFLFKVVMLISPSATAGAVRVKRHWDHMVSMKSRQKARVTARRRHHQLISI